MVVIARNLLHFLLLHSLVNQNLIRLSFDKLDFLCGCVSSLLDLLLIGPCFFNLLVCQVKLTFRLQQTIRNLFLCSFGFFDLHRLLLHFFFNLLNTTLQLFFLLVKPDVFFTHLSVVGFYYCMLGCDRV